MKTNLIAASLLALAMGVGVAHAEGEGNGNPFPNTEAGHFVVANQVLSDTGSESIPHFGGRTTALTQGDLLPANGSEGAVQTANSLPVGAEEGTVAYAQAQSVQRWVLAHQVPASRLAMRQTAYAD